MNSELYTAASGLLVEERRLELIANNLANLSTTGYRPLRSFSTMFARLGPEALPTVRAANAAVAIAGTYEHPGPGPLVPTGRELDVALEPDQLLVVRAAAGRLYTRAGSMEVSPAGVLTDSNGYPVLNPKGETIEGLSPNASIDGGGRVIDGGAEVGRLLVVRHDPTILRREGDGLLSAAGRDAALETVAEPIMRPGSVEGSTADAVSELVRLIETRRAFESYQKLVSLTMNEVNRRAVNDLARP